MNIEIVNGSDNTISFNLPVNQKVITLPSTENFITVQPAALVASVETITRGDDVDLSSDINVTNTDGAFTHVSSFSAGTSIESVLRQILEKYNRTTIALNGVTRALQSTGGSYGSASEVTSNQTLEIGRGVQVTAFRITVGDSTQTTDTSVKFLRGSTEVEAGLTDTTGTKTLTSADTQDPGTITSVSYSATVIDDGGACEPDQTLTSGTIKFEWKHRVRMGSSTATGLADDAAAQALFDGMSTVFDALRGESDFTVTANAGMDTASNYTWIVYPVSFGNLSEVLLGATDVLSDFESPVDKNLTNDYGVTTSYRFYRSTFDDAFSSGQNLTIKF